MSLILSDLRDGIATITLNRPEKLNAFVGSMREDLLQALRDAAGNADCRVAVITGAGRAFSAGGDVAFSKGCKRIATSMVSTNCWQRAPRSSCKSSRCRSR